MTAPDTPTRKARKEFLVAFDDMRLTGKLLSEFLLQAQNTTPDLMESYASNDVLDAIEPTRSEWSHKYYSRQKFLAERNFSEERLEHLIEVREYFRQEGYKGFFPQALNRETFGVDQTSQARCREESRPLYQPSVNLKKFVGEGDLRTIRTALRLELNDNRNNGEDLRSALEWVKTEVPELCVPYEEKAFAREMDSDRSHWVMEYYDNQTVYLKTNFSEVRFLHLVEVREHLRQLGVEGFVAITTPSAQSASHSRVASSAAEPTPSTPSSESRPARPDLNPIFKIALLFGGALAAVVVYLSLVK